jgi:hypothetical protein
MTFCLLLHLQGFCSLFKAEGGSFSFYLFPTQMQRRDCSKAYEGRKGFLFVHRQHLHQGLEPWTRSPTGQTKERRPD